MAECRVLQNLAEYDLSDIYRKIHGYRVQAQSWAGNNGETPRRIDHIFASASLGPRTVVYRNDWQFAKLSDHAAIEAEFAPTTYLDVARL